MGSKIKYWICGVLCYHPNSYGEIDDTLIRERIESGCHIINFSTEDRGIQFYFKNKIYDFQKQNDEYLVTEWKYRLNGKKRKHNQVITDENWAKNVITHLLKQKIRHNLFIDGKFEYRTVGKDRNKSYKRQQKDHLKEEENIQNGKFNLEETEIKSEQEEKIEIKDRNFDINSSDEFQEIAKPSSIKPEQEEKSEIKNRNFDINSSDEFQEIAKPSSIKPEQEEKIEIKDRSFDIDSNDEFHRIARPPSSVLKLHKEVPKTSGFWEFMGKFWTGVAGFGLINAAIDCFLK